MFTFVAAQVNPFNAMKPERGISPKSEPLYSCGKIDIYMLVGRIRRATCSDRATL
jgi:hypothetical protein